MGEAGASVDGEDGGGGLLGAVDPIGEVDVGVWTWPVGAMTGMGVWAATGKVRTRVRRRVFMWTPMVDYRQLTRPQKARTDGAPGFVVVAWVGPSALGYSVVLSLGLRPRL